ncbi:zinc ribbon domain-containing protein [Natrinema sp. DC36]|uniref:zinc ribbon domain-containing protein n=1 Tax=Natrinema sp. DC36 TaxID=2878680 RepID=UPI0031F31CF6
MSQMPIGIDLGERYLYVACPAGMPDWKGALMVRGEEICQQLDDLRNQTVALLAGDDYSREAIAGYVQQRHDAIVDLIDAAAHEVCEYASAYDDPVIVLEDSHYDPDLWAWLTDPDAHRGTSWLLSTANYRLRTVAGEYRIEVETVPEEYTSQECHVCGAIGERKLNETFRCTNPTCWETTNYADSNAAKVIAQRYQSGRRCDHVRTQTIIPPTTPTVATDGGHAGGDDLAHTWYILADAHQDPARVIGGPFTDPREASRRAGMRPGTAGTMSALWLVHNIQHNDYSVEWTDGVDRPGVLVATDGSGHVCDACGETFRTLTRLRLHERDSCPQRETFDKIEPDAPDAGLQAAEGLLTCRSCDCENPNADYDQTVDVADDDYHLIVEFDCRHCGFENENRVVMTGVDSDDLENLPPHLQPDDDIATDGGSADLEGLSTHDLVGMALGEHDDQEAKDGIPTGDVVDWIVSRTELVRADVHDAIGWLHDRGHVYEPRPDRLRRTEVDSERWLSVAWHEALVEARVKAGDLDPRYLTDRYGAETPTEVDELVQQAVKEVIRGDNGKLTLDDLDVAEEKLEEAGYEIVTDGGFHSGDHHVLYDDQPEPEPSLEDLCTEDGCTETVHGRCGCCGMSLCGRHNEVQGGFCSNFERVAGVPGCLVWSSEFHVYQRAFYDSEIEVLEFNGTYCLEEDDEPLCGSDLKRLEHVELQDIDHEYDLCAECEDVAIDRLAEDEDGGESA